MINHSNWTNLEPDEIRYTTSYIYEGGRKKGEIGGKMKNGENGVEVGGSQGISGQ